MVRVMGTTRAYFEHYRYARTESLAFTAGGAFDDVFDAVLGAEVPERLGYALGDELIVSHGAGEVSFVEHDDKPFRVAGILAPTGTPVDRTAHVSVEGFTAMHVDWRAGAGCDDHRRRGARDGSHPEDHHRLPGGPRHEDRHLRCAAAAGTMTLSVALVIALAAAGPAVAAPGDVRDLEWEDLMPKGWDSLAGLDALQGDDAQSLSENSARAIELFNAYQEAVRSAPVVGGLDGQQVRLPGFMVPLDFEGTETSEFLLVPYFGACIHVPPPPSNRIVYVETVAGYPMKELFDPVWVAGVISTQAFLNDVDDAGYTMQATIIEPY